MVGAAFGLGFIFGPVIGGVLAGSDAETTNFLIPALVASSLTMAALLGVIFVLPESLSQGIRDQIRAQPKTTVGDRLKSAFNRRALTLLVCIGFAVTMAWALLETTLALWANAILSFGPREIGLLLTYVGVISVIIQGGMIGPLTKRFGERALVAVAVCFLFGGYGVLAATQGWTLLIVSMTLLAIGNALANPSLSSLVSKEADDIERGAVLGVYQGASSLARVAGPIYAGVVFVRLGPATPLEIAALCMVPALVMMMALPKRL
jgi:DHA1 family tetracycline resistance protein-like MFS transporter